MLDEAVIVTIKQCQFLPLEVIFMFKGKEQNIVPTSYHIVILTLQGMSGTYPLVIIINYYVSQSEKAAGPAVEETSKQSEQNKVCATRTNHKS